MRLFSENAGYRARLRGLMPSPRDDSWEHCMQASLANSNAKLYTAKDFKWVTGSINVLGVHVSNNIEMLGEQNVNE